MADIERMLVAWLPQQFPGIRVGTKTPAGDSFAEAVITGLVRVRRVGGGRTQSLKHPTVVYDCLKADGAGDFAEQVAGSLYWRLPGAIIGDGVVSGVEEISGPSWAPWDNTTVERYTGTVRIHFKDVPS